MENAKTLPPDIPAATIRLYLKHEAEDGVASANNFAALIKANPWLLKMDDYLVRLLALNASRRSKIRSLYIFADRINSAVTPFSACNTDRCSHCCHQAVALTAGEAARIGEALGVAPMRPAASYDRSASTRAYSGVRCTFLDEQSRCSIYEHRPIACRTYFSIGATPFFCDTAIPSEQSKVRVLELSRFWYAYAVIFNDPLVGDIREFFPQGVRSTPMAP
jgi:Fe-S-cluster containining protein